MVKARIPSENLDAILKDYEQEYKNFSWLDLEKHFSWSESGNVNIAHEAIDRWARDRDRPDRKAMIYEKEGEIQEYTFGKLREISSQWANLFIELGVCEGDRIFIFLKSCPEIYFIMIACARLGVVFCPLFTSLGLDELSFRIRDSKPRFLITQSELTEKLPTQMCESIERVIFLRGPKPNFVPREIVIDERLEGLPKKSPIKWVSGTTPLFLTYTSGATGPPKGIIHAHHDMLGYLLTAGYVLNLNSGDILWTDADPAWITGTVYGGFAPWLCGAISVIQGDDFSASTWYRTLERHKVNCFYTTPRTITKLIAAGNDLPERYGLQNLTHIATTGENLSPDQFYWVKEYLKLAPHDTWWMTETGMISIANFPSLPIKPGSMGKPMPGIQAAVLDDRGEELAFLTLGELALKIGWPAMMTGVWQDAPRYQAYFRFTDWFMTGDMVIRDEDGYFFHQGRNDDLIKVADAFIGPYDIEQILTLHPAVLEAAAISVGSLGAKPTVKAYVVLKNGVIASTRLNQEIKSFLKANLSPDIPLSEVEFMVELPKASSGKVLRRVLRAKEKGLPAGDLLNMRD